MVVHVSNAAEIIKETYLFKISVDLHCHLLVNVVSEHCVENSIIQRHTYTYIYNMDINSHSNTQ